MTRFWFLMALLYTMTAQAGEAERVFENVRRSVVTITTLDERNEIDGEGSGIVIGPDRVVTNCHVVQEATAIRVRSDGRDLQASYSSGDVQRDLCLLEVPGLKMPTIQIRSYQTIRIGEPVFAIGNPLGFGLSVSTGIVSSVRQQESKQEREIAILTNAPISPGSSGGGLFDAQGHLLGITTAHFGGAQNLNVSLPADWIAELSKSGAPRPPAINSVSRDRDWEGQATSLQNSRQWTALAELTRNWLTAYPASALAGSYLGLALFNLGQLQEARQTLLAALQHNPRNVTALGYLAVVRRGLGEKDVAASDLQRALAIVPFNGYLWRVSAIWQKEDGHADQAITSIQTALKYDPGYADNWEVLGVLRHQQSRHKEAIDAYRVALRLNPNHSSAIGNLANALVVIGDLDAGREMLMKPHAVQTNEAVTWENLGLADQKNGRHAEAEKEFRKALELNPNLHHALRNLAFSLTQTSRRNEAEDALRQALKLKPDFADAWSALAELLALRNDHAGAKEAFEKAIAADPSSVGIWYALAIERRHLQDFTGAADAADQAVRLAPSNSAMWGFLGETRMRLNQPESALKAFLEAEKLNPKNVHALQALAAYFGGRGEHDKSIGYMERALEIDPASPNSWSNKGYSLLKLARYPEAVEALQTAIRLQPDFTNAWINLGETYLRQKQIGKAIPALERALNLAPSSPDARLYISQAFVASGQYAKGKEHLEILLKQAPTLLPAVYLLTAANIAQGNKPEALAAYARLKNINPRMARELREQSRMRGMPIGFELPE